MTKRLCTILLAGACVLSLSACTNNHPADDTSSTSSAVSTEETASSTEGLTGEELLKQTTKEEYLDLLYPVLRDLGELNEVSSITFGEIFSTEYEDSMLYGISADITVGARKLAVSYYAYNDEVILSYIRNAEDWNHYYYFYDNNGFFSIYDYYTDELLEHGTYDQMLEQAASEQEETSSASDASYESTKQKLAEVMEANSVAIDNISFNKDFTIINIYVDPLLKDAASTGMAYLEIYDICKEYRASSDNPDAEMTAYIYNSNTEELIDSGPIPVDQEEE